jgi:alpha-beta hydrolase superfamily lysophospholipase
MIKNQVPEISEKDFVNIKLNPLIQKLRKHPDANFCEYGFFHTQDTTRLFYRFWRLHQDYNDGRNKSRNLIVFFHGMAGQTEYWQLLADRLIGNCDMIGYDLRGHGYSSAGNEIRGDITDFSMFARDSEEFIDWLVKDKDIFNRYRSVFLLGESMGTVVVGNLILNGILNRYKAQNYNFSGIIYFAPAFSPKVSKVSFKDIYTNIVNVLLYPFNKRALRVYTRGHEEIGAWDPIHQEYDRTDPLHLDYISLRYLLQIKKGYDQIKRKGGCVVTMLVKNTQKR